MITIYDLCHLCVNTFKTLNVNHKVQFLEKTYRIETNAIEVRE